MLGTQCTQDIDESDKMFKMERNGGNYGAGTKEVQERNYVAVSELGREAAHVAGQLKRRPAPA